MELTTVIYQKALVLVLFKKIIKVKIMPNLNMKVDCVLNTPLYLGGFFFPSITFIQAEKKFLKPINDNIYKKALEF